MMSKVMGSNSNLDAGTGTKTALGKGLMFLGKSGWNRNASQYYKIKNAEGFWGKTSAT